MAPEKKIIHLTQNSPFESSYSTFTTLCNHHQDLISEQFYHPPPKKTLMSIKSSDSLLPLLQPVATTDLRTLCLYGVASSEHFIQMESQYVAFFIWLFSLCIVFSRFTHVVVFVSASFCFLFFHEKAFIRSFSIHSSRHCSQRWDPHVSSSLDFSGKRQTRNKISRLWVSADSWTRTSWEKGTTWLFYTKWSRKGTLRNNI